MRYVTGGTRPALDYDAIRDLMIVMPSPIEQGRVVEIMQNAYAAEDFLHRENIKGKEEIGKYFFDKLGISSLDIKPEHHFAMLSEDVSENRLDPHYWRPHFKELEMLVQKGKYTTRDLGDFITEINYGASVGGQYVEAGIPLIRITNLNDDEIDISNIVYLPESERKNIGGSFTKKGDLLISRSGSIGIVAVVDEETDGFAFGSFMIRFRLSEDINKYFVSIWINGRIGRMFLEREKIGAVQGNITIGSIRGVQIPVQPTEVQDQSVNEFNKYKNLVQSRQHKAELTKGDARRSIEAIIINA